MKRLKDIFNTLWTYQFQTMTPMLVAMSFVKQGNVGMVAVGLILTAGLAAKGARQKAEDLHKATCKCGNQERPPQISK